MTTNATGPSAPASTRAANQPATGNPGDSRERPADQRRVVCAAVRDARGCLVLSIRHYDRFMDSQIWRRTDGYRFKRRLDEDQGFVDQHGTFMSREEAYQVALAAGQILYPERCGHGLDGPKLYSEGLY